MYKRQTIHSHLISTFYLVTVPVPTQIFKMKVTIIFVLIAAVFVLTASAFSIAEQGKFNTFLYKTIKLYFIFENVFHAREDN
jgi:hypothetical protein